MEKLDDLYDDLLRLYGGLKAQSRGTKQHLAITNDQMDFHSVTDGDTCITSNYIYYTLFNINVKQLVGIAKLMHPSPSLWLTH